MMNDPPSSGRKRSASPSQDSDRQIRSRQNEGPDDTAAVKTDNPAYDWWQEWTWDEIHSFSYCYQKEISAVKEANSGLDRQALSLVCNQELKRLIKRDVARHYKLLKEHKQQKYKLKEEEREREKRRRASKTPQPTAASQSTTSQNSATNGKTGPNEPMEPVGYSSSSERSLISYNGNKRDGSGSPSPSTSITLTDEQQAIFDKVKEGQSLMFTGRAGTGKSVLIEEIAKWCRRNRVRCSVTATTGLAAMNIGGQTIHSWTGLGFLKGSVPHCLKMLKSEERKLNWCDTDLLIIDEASQLSASTFDKIDEIARIIRAKRSKFEQGSSWSADYSPKGYAEDPRTRHALQGKDLRNVPFGGMQVVCVGDFFQIAPIPDYNPPKANSEDIPQQKRKKKEDIEPDYLFKSKAFRELFDHNKFCLTIAQRQEEGSEFSQMLDLLGKFRGDQKTASTLRSYFSQFEGTHDEDKEVVYLCGTNDEVSKINANSLRRLDGPEVCFIASDYRNTEYKAKEINDVIRRSIRAEAVVRLKPGAQIIYLKNDKNLGLVNGHLGRVAFLLTEELHRKYEKDYVVLFPLYQYFRNTGMRMEFLGKECPDGIESMTGTCFKHPWKYYLEALIAIDNSYRTEAKAQVKPFDTGNSETNNIPPDPSLNTSLEVVIRVGVNQGEQSNKFFRVNWSDFEELDYSRSRQGIGRDMKREHPVICRRTQLPLALSWALTIHKSQGQTLRRTMVNLSRVDGGQAYVALSRVRSPDDLRLVSFQLPCKPTPLSVHEFDKTIRRIP